MMVDTYYTTENISTSIMGALSFKANACPHWRKGTRQGDPSRQDLIDANRLLESASHSIIITPKQSPLSGELNASKHRYHPVPFPFPSAKTPLSCLHTTTNSSPSPSPSPLPLETHPTDRPPYSPPHLPTWAHPAPSRPPLPPPQHH